MSKSAKSVLVFGIYLGIIGLVLLIAPNSLLIPFGIETTNEVWIRLSGILMMAIAVYYILGARHEIIIVIKATAYIRLTIIFFFTAFVILDLVSPNILFFALVDFGGGIWTYLMLKKEGHIYLNF